MRVLSTLPYASSTQKPMETFTAIWNITVGWEGGPKVGRVLAHNAMWAGGALGGVGGMLFLQHTTTVTLLWPWLKGQHTNMCIDYILCKHSYAWPSLPGANNSVPNTSVFICTLFSRCLFQSSFCRHCRGDCWRLISSWWWRWTGKSPLWHFSVFIPFHKLIQQHWPSPVLVIVTEVKVDSPTEF